MMKRIQYLIISLLLLCPLSCAAEVETVLVQWRAGLCTPSCTQGLEKEFHKISGVETVTMDGESGRATLKWRPNASFSYTQIKRAMQMIGLSIRDARVKVKGTLEVKEERVDLVSTGDKTRFKLVSPLTPVEGKYVEKYNLLSRTLTPEQLALLIQAAESEKIAQVQGPLLMPWRAPPLVLVIENVQFSDPEPEEKEKSTQRRRGKRETRKRASRT